MKKILIWLISLTVVVHAFGIMMPEIGFDALWYHLPIVKDMADSHEIRVVANIPQSNQPRLGEMVFLPWYMAMGTTGVKICTFWLMLILLFSTYKLARNFLSENYALLVVLLAASYHTVAWQATSGYVDILRAIFEIGILYLITRKQKIRFEFIVLAILMGLALATKLVTLIFLPAILLFIWLKRDFKYGFGLGIIALVICVVGRFPIFFISSVGHELLGWGSIVGSLRSLLFLPLEMSFHRESYMSPIYLVVLPFIFQQRIWLWQKYKSEIIFIGLTLTTWVFVVPISVRYDLSGIIFATIFCFMAMIKSFNLNAWIKSVFVLTVLVFVGFNMAIRLYVLARNFPYLTGQISKGEYMRSVDQGILKGPLEKWYGL